MKARSYLIRPQARLDIAEIALYIADDSPRIAHAFLDALEKTLNALVVMPHMGARQKYKHLKLKDVRVVMVNKFPHYLVFYLPLSRHIEVIRVIHDARDVPKIFVI